MDKVSNDTTIMLWAGLMNTTLHVEGGVNTTLHVVVRAIHHIFHIAIAHYQHVVGLATVDVVGRAINA